jgi:cytochrome oxidase assembly protein ShyY1
MRYAIIWFSLAGLLLIAFAVSLRGNEGYTDACSQ